ncbi:MAG: tRNA (adenosine(37)-N6)-threonylcarbamoyltransferase complex ATPase subunit type 1 TsaE [Candidatus Saccharicenans sp.]
MNQKSVDLVFKSRSEDQTLALAAKLAENFVGTELVLITGELGAGKTVFVKGLAIGLKVEDSDSVCSPSFTLVNVYEGQITLFHVDLYRLEDPEEIADLGLEDYFGTGVVAVEWAERLPFRIEGERTVKVVIEVEPDDSRTIRVEAPDIYLSLENS